MPGSAALGDASEARRAAEEIGYPVVLKASAGGGGNPRRAIDGNTNGIWGAGTTTHTNGAPSWWEVDLQNTYDIGTVVLWNRLDCCSERLTNFTVSILAADGTVNWEEAFLTAGERIDGPNFTIDGIEAEGHYLRIAMPGPILSLAEVQIYSETADEDWEPTTQVTWNSSNQNVATLSSTVD